MNPVSAINFEGNKQPKVKRRYGNKGIIRASYASSLASVPLVVLSSGVTKGMKKISDLNPNDVVQLRKATQTGLKNTGLYEKGVRAYYMQDTAAPKAKEILNNLAQNVENLENNAEGIAQKPMQIIESFLPVKYTKKDKKALEALKTEVEAVCEKRFDKLSKRMNAIGNAIGEKGAKGSAFDLGALKETINETGARVMGITFKTGKNACYLPHANKIITPEKALQTSIFHEMGHALNNNGGIVMKTLQKARPMAKIIPTAILLVSLFNKRKTTDEKSDNKVQNFFDGVKKNAGKLTFLGMLPMIAEETIASLRGGMIAEKLAKSGDLSKNVLNRIRLTNACSFGSYLMAGLATAGATALAVKVKDSIQQKYEDKKNAKYDIKDAKLEAKQQAKEAKKANKI